MKLSRLLSAGLLVLMMLLPAAMPAAAMPAADLAAGSMPAAMPAAAAQVNWDAGIAVVWPHDGLGNPTSVVYSRAVNVSVWPRGQAVCGANPNPIALYMAQNNQPAEVVRTNGQLIQRTYNGVTFPSLEYNDIPANLAASPGSQYRFFLNTTNTNVWVHAGDARTYAPTQYLPAGYTGSAPGEVDTRIQVVWPHNQYGQYVTPASAVYVNIAVDIFAHGSAASVPPEYNPPSGLTLRVAQNNGALYETAAVQKTTYSSGGLTYPRWVFNDVPVTPGQQYHFMVMVPGLNTHPTVWTHARDARTYLPNPQPPAGGCTPPPAACSQPLNAREQQLRAQFPALGCPLGAATSPSMAREPFQRGQMFWRAAANGQNAMIFVLNSGGSWQSYFDMWQAGQPESDPALVPPAGLFQPVRGFGKVWREQLGGPNSAVGWATGIEVSAPGQLEQWQNGLSFDFNGDAYAVLNNGTWQH